MSDIFIQGGNLSGAVSSTGTIQGNVAAEGILNGEISASGTLQGEITAEKTLQGEMKSEGQLEGTIQMPEKVFIEGGKVPKISEVTLLAADWVGEDNLYRQVVEIDGVTENSQVDLTPDVHQLLVFYEKDLTFVTENENGIVTVYVIGQKPLNDYTIQVTITEVEL